MLGKFALALTIVGTVSCAANRPVIPRWISADKYGSAYVLVNNWNGTYSYEASASFSWDFDYNCARTYAYSYSTYEWAESSYCNNKVVEYSSETGCSSFNAGYYNLEDEVKKEIDQFTISWGTGYTDPVWNYGEYHVLEHKSDYVYIYMRPSDKAIEYIVESYPSYQADVVTYYPYGLTVDDSSIGVWDYDLRYGYCANNMTSFSLSNKVFHHGKALSAKPALEKPALTGKPSPMAAASKLGGVRSLFSAKPKTMVAAAPSKASFVVAKDQVAEKAPLNLFKAATPKADEKKLKSLMKTKPSNDERFLKVKSYINNFKGESLASNDLQAEVDEAFAIVDVNRDGFISKDELKSAIIAEGQPVTDEEIAFVFLLIDANQDGKLSWNECYKFAKSQGGLNLYTRSEKVNLIFQWYDNNSDGYLNQAEVKRLLIDSYGYATDSDAQWFIALVDTNWDGKISWYELYNAIQ